MYITPFGRPVVPRVVDRDHVLVVGDLERGAVIVLGGGVQERSVWGAGSVAVVDDDARDVTGHELLEVGVHKDHARAGVVEDVGDVVLGKPRVHRHQNRSHGGHREVGLQQLGDVGAQERHPIARLDPGVPEPGRQPVGAPGELRVGIPPLAIDHGRPVGEHRCGAGEEWNRREHLAVDGTVGHAR